MAMKIQEIKIKSVLNRSAISDYTLNCYIGCQHACNYCYAKYISFYRGHKEKWGTYVDIKINVVKILKKEIQRPINMGRGEVMMSSICDGWQPVEARYELSRQCLEILLKSGFKVRILTKSRLILRDFDILRMFKNQVELGLTITTFNHKLQHYLEPFAATSYERLNVIRKANKAGISSWVFLGPLIPGFTGTFGNIRDLFNRLSDVKLSHIYIDNFHYYNAHYMALKKSIGTVYPERFKRYLTPDKYQSDNNQYNKAIKEYIIKLSNRLPEVPDILF